MSESESLTVSALQIVDEDDDGVDDCHAPFVVAADARAEDSERPAGCGR